MRHPLDFLEDIRAKPDHMKKLIGAAFVVVIMAIVIGVWATTIDLSISSKPVAASEADLNSPLETFWNFANDSVKSLF
jgi:hypothetical protein